MTIIPLFRHPFNKKRTEKTKQTNKKKKKQTTKMPKTKQKEHKTTWRGTFQPQWPKMGKYEWLLTIILIGLTQWGKDSKCSRCICSNDLVLITWTNRLTSQIKRLITLSPGTHIVIFLKVLHPPVSFYGFTYKIILFCYFLI